MTNEERFNQEHSNRYDVWIRRSIPGYESLHDMAMYFVKTGMEDKSAKPRLLIAGSGTGMEISHFAAKNPAWTFTGADPSPDMTAVAKNRVEELGLTERVRLHTGLVHELPENDEPFDAATLMLVMHFLPDDGAKLALLESVATRLKPGATFVHADLHADENSPRYSRFVEAWMSRQRDLGLSDEDAKKWFDDLRDNVHFVTEARISALLTEVGFTNIERFYNALLFGGWVAKKSG